MEYLLRTEHSDWIDAAVADGNHDLHIPSLCDVEVTAAVRRALMSGAVEVQRAEEAVVDYLDLPLTRHGQQALILRMLDLRETFSAYDATYVALAELLGGHLLTADKALARSVRTHQAIPVMSH